MRFVVIPSPVFFHNAGRSTPRISWRVVDVDRGLHPGSKFPHATVATCNDQTTADRIAAHLNGGTRFDEIAWQGYLDHANRNAVEARKALELKAAEADMLRTQLFETREQRDEARESSAANGAEAARALTENAELRKALEASHREIAEARHYWANQGPHDHDVISLAAYNKLVAERDEAQAKLDKLVGGGSPADNEILLALARHINRVCFKP